MALLLVKTNFPFVSTFVVYFDQQMGASNAIYGKDIKFKI